MKLRKKVGASWKEGKEGKVGKAKKVMKINRVQKDKKGQKVLAYQLIHFRLLAEMF